MIDRDAGGKRCPDLLMALSDILHINARRHRGERNNRVKHVVDAAHHKCHIPRKDMMREAVEEADNNEDQRV